MEFSSPETVQMLRLCCLHSRKLGFIVMMPNCEGSLDYIKPDFCVTCEAWQTHRDHISVCIIIIIVVSVVGVVGVAQLCFPINNF